MIDDDVRAPVITISGSPTDAEVAAVLAALCGTPPATDTTGQGRPDRAGESSRRWRTARATSATYRWPHAWNRPG